MLIVTEAAGAYLAQMLNEAKAADDVAVRFVRAADRWKLRLDSSVAGDTTFALEGKTVLVLDEQMSQLLTHKTVDLEETREGPKLVVF